MKRCGLCELAVQMKFSGLLFVRLAEILSNGNLALLLLAYVQKLTSMVVDSAAKMVSPGITISPVGPPSDVCRVCCAELQEGVLVEAWPNSTLCHADLHGISGWERQVLERRKRTGGFIHVAATAHRRNVIAEGS